MNIGVLIEVAIGVLFVWILLAAITSQLQEWISQWAAWRPKMLEESVKGILANDNLAKDFYEHPLIVSLHNKTKKGKMRMPSQIPNRQFASVVFDMFINAGTEKSAATDMKATLQKLQANVASIRGDKENPMKDLAKSLDTILIDVSMDVEKADKSIAEARNRVETWFGDAMDRLGGAYKRKLQLWSIVIGIVLATALNADSLAIANTLWSEPLVRAALVAQAEQLKLEDLGITGESQSSTNPQGDAQQNVVKLQSLPIPLGWTTDNIPPACSAKTQSNQCGWTGWLMKVGGIILSGLAAAQGAPFWFDIMRKLLNFRGGGGSAKKEEKDEAKG